ncbi:MAG TPA: hypothetical protein EYH34_09730 [Planctomycetes bacterium]|nr:hypothetical protein [Planctomycetota bacterium]
MLVLTRKVRQELVIGGALRVVVLKVDARRDVRKGDLRKENVRQRANGRHGNDGPHEGHEGDGW